MCRREQLLTSDETSAPRSPARRPARVPVRGAPELGAPSPAGGRLNEEDRWARAIAKYPNHSDAEIHGHLAEFHDRIGAVDVEKARRQALARVDESADRGAARFAAVRPPENRRRGRVYSLVR